ncbi:MAG TPA: hypothetical protein VJW23_18425, partial [Propionibacteriaceae bacterium]|nr:hypothetical protein [Propionibacteriaceae bacterium]
VGFEFCTPEEQAARFDFRCCQMVVWLSADGEIHAYQCDGAEADATAKLLTVMNNNGTERTIGRIQRYEEKYGYTLVFDEVDQEPIEEDERPLGAPSFDFHAYKVRRYVDRLPIKRSGYSG